MDLYEGKFHQVKRMLKAVGNEVMYLKRIIIGNLYLDENLSPGEYRELDENEIKRILAQVLFEFPIKEIKIDMPRWITSLEKDHWIRSEVFSNIEKSASNITKIREVQDITNDISECKFVKSAELLGADLGVGHSKIGIRLNDDLFYKVLSEKTGVEIADECELMNCMMELTSTRKKFEKISEAYDSVTETGYGIVLPTIEELTLEEPEIIKQGGKYGIRLKAGAPSVHMMKTNITTEITPIVGSEQQSEELVQYLLEEFEEEPTKIWQSNIFGKSLHELVNEGLHNKLNRMPEDARTKVKETIERIINEGCNGLICILI